MPDIPTLPPIPPLNQPNSSAPSTETAAQQPTVVANVATKVGDMCRLLTQDTDAGFKQRRKMANDIWTALGVLDDPTLDADLLLAFGMQVKAALKDPELRERNRAAGRAEVARRMQAAAGRPRASAGSKAPTPKPGA